MVLYVNGAEASLINTEVTGVSIPKTVTLLSGKENGCSNICSLLPINRELFKEKINRSYFPFSIVARMKQKYYFNIPHKKYINIYSKILK